MVELGEFWQVNQALDANRNPCGGSILQTLVKKYVDLSQSLNNYVYRGLCEFGLFCRTPGCHLGPEQCMR